MVHTWMVCMYSAAQGKRSDEDDLFDWDPKAKEGAEASGAGRKRKGDATKEHKQRKKKARPPGVPYLCDLHGG